jgi:hypothetical protein
MSELLNPMRGVIVGADFEPPGGDPTVVHVAVAVPFNEAVVAKEVVFIVPAREGIVIVDTDSFTNDDDGAMALTRFAEYVSTMLPRGVRMSIASPDDDGVPQWTVSRG